MSVFKIYFVVFSFSFFLQLCRGQDPIGCDVVGECQDSTVIGVSHVGTLEDCQLFCQGLAGCLFYTYYSTDGVRLRGKNKLCVLQIFLALF